MQHLLWEHISAGRVFRRAAEALSPPTATEAASSENHLLAISIASAGGFHPRLFSSDQTLTSFPLMMEELYVSLV